MNEADIDVSGVEACEVVREIPSVTKRAVLPFLKNLWFAGAVRLGAEGPALTMEDP